MSIIKIQINYLTDVAWNNAANCDFDLKDKTDVWRINIRSNLPLLDSFSEILHADEIARANRYHQAKYRDRFVISRGALRTILGKYLNLQPALIEFKTVVNKKPAVDNTNQGRRCYFNISHSGDWILVAVSGSEIGADTEQVNFTFNYEDVLQDNFSDAEIGYINQNAAAERFFILWTRKEALLKATAKGLDEDLKLIPSLDGVHAAESSTISSGDDWQISTFKLSENYVATIANNIKIVTIRFWDILF
jgi:4'-phosphopantetheinyl transferase